MDIENVIFVVGLVVVLFGNVSWLDRDFFECVLFDVGKDYVVGFMIEIEVIWVL